MRNRQRARPRRFGGRFAGYWGGIFAALLVAGLFLTGIVPPRKMLTPTDLAVFAQYDVLRRALAHEQSDEARSAAGKLEAI